MNLPFIPRTELPPRWIRFLHDSLVQHLRINLGVVGLREHTTTERDGINAQNGDSLYNSTSGNPEDYYRAQWVGRNGLPTLTEAQRDALTPANGDQIYNSTAGEAQIYAGGSWYELGVYPKWTDLCMPTQSFKTSGVTDPDWANVTGNLYAWAFDGGGARDERVMFAMQIPHSWDGVTALQPHVHWAPSDGSSGNVRWGFEYSWVSLDGVFPAATTIYAEDATAEVTNTHQIASFASIDVGSISGMSSMLLCSVFRHATHANDTYNNQDAFLLEFDVHIKMDALGSTSEFVK